MYQLNITVTDTSGARGKRPVTGGVPIAKGAAPEGSTFLLRTESGEPVPLQADVIARWEDGGARWVTLSFIAGGQACAVERYVLTAGTEPGPVCADEAPSVRVGESRLARIADRFDIAFCAVDSGGEVFEAVPETWETTGGPIHSITSISGSFRSADGGRLFGFRLWAHAFAGISKILLEPLIVIDPESGHIQRVRELALDIVPLQGTESAKLGGEPGWEGASDSGVRLFQVDDENYTIEGAGVTGGRAPGWAEVGPIAVALRDFRQQWPKSLEVIDDGLRIGLFPRFAEGAFAHMEPWYKSDYLFEGECYRLRTGQARRWQVWVDLEGDGPALAAHANAPLVPAADPAQAIETGVWGSIAPAGSPAMTDYDPLAEKLFDGYLSAIAESRDYGAMNWGDWFGERKCNWANNEYDVSRQMLVQFARTGDPKYLHMGMTVARHTSEVDMIHSVNSDLVSYFIDEVCGAYTNRSIIDNCPIRPGMMHAHCVGHVGGFHSIETIRELYVSFTTDSMGKPYLCLDPYNVGHVFAQGMAYCYFLTGDPWIRETLDRIGNNLASLVEDRKLPFTGRSCAGRELGWPMLSLAAIYELDFDKRYLDAMRILAEDALAEQDPNCGGWLQEMFGGHCNCEKRHHVGEAAFITSIRINGLARYYRLSGDQRIPECIRRGIDNMNETTWRETVSGWRYTSCPASPFMHQQGVTMMAMANAVDLLGEEEHLRILRKAWGALCERLNTPAGAGKGYGPSAYGSAEAARAQMSSARA